MAQNYFAFDIRTKLDSGTVQRYAGAIKAGQEFPPVRVMVVDGVPILIDGYHRVTAYESLGIQTVMAEVSTGTKEDALGAAAQANLTHGLPLKNKEVRKAFQFYIRSGQYKKGKARKSYREIGLVIGVSYNTIRNWMKRDFPRLFRQYAGEDVRGTGGLQDREKQGPVEMDVASKLAEVVRQYQATADKETREAIEGLLVDTLQQIKPERVVCAGDVSFVRDDSDF